MTAYKKGWILHVMFTYRDKENPKTYPKPYRNWSTFKNRKGTKYQSYLILPESQKKKAQKIWDNYMNRYPGFIETKYNKEWFAIGGDLIEYNNPVDVVNFVRNLKHFTHYPVKF